MRYRHLFENDDLRLNMLAGADLHLFINRNEDANPDVFNRLQYLNPGDMNNEIHLVHFDGRRVVSSLALELNPYDDREFWLKHVIVDEDYRNRGLASELYQAAVDYARNQNKAIKRSSSTVMGQKYLSHVVDRIKAKNFDVEIREWNK